MFTFSYFVKLRVGRDVGFAVLARHRDNIVVDFLNQEVGNLFALVDALKRLLLVCKFIHPQSSLTCLLITRLISLRNFSIASLSLTSAAVSEVGAKRQISRSCAVTIELILIIAHICESRQSGYNVYPFFFLLITISTSCGSSSHERSGNRLMPTSSGHS